jgi:hypothetical protein
VLDDTTISLIELYKLFLHKERLLYTSLNKLKKGEKIFTGFCWIPSCERNDILNKIDGIKE